MSDPIQARSLSPASREATGEGTLYEAVFRASPDAILIANDDADFVAVNHAACSILGRSPEELIGKQVRSFLEFRDDATSLWEKALGGGSVQAEISLKRPDGERRVIELAIVARIEPGRHMLLIRDLTLRKTLDEQLRMASKMEAIGRLAGGVAHDFNNLLMVISSYTEMMLDSMAEADPMRKKAEEVMKASTRAANLTRQLLAFSRKQVLDPQLQDINLLVREVSKLLLRVLGENVPVVHSLGQDVGLVRADRGQLEQVLMHLAVNARDVMPKGGTLTIRTANTEFDASCSRLPGSPPPGHYVMLAVEDTGDGMSKEVLAHLFEPFFSTKGFGKGTGLGLAAVYGIVKQSGGFIWVDSEAGKGTCFRMYFPRAHHALEVAEEPLEAPVPQEREITVLLVDDEEALLTAATEFLKLRGFRVLAARDGSEALSVAAKLADRLDALVTDIVMPGISGRVLAHELLKVHPETRILYTSGYPDAAGIEIEDTSAFLRKPFRFDALTLKIREILGLTRRIADDPGPPPGGH